MYVLQWWSVYVLTRRLFWYLFPDKHPDKRIYEQRIKTAIFTHRPCVSPTVLHSADDVTLDWFSEVVMTRQLWLEHMKSDL